MIIGPAQSGKSTFIGHTFTEEECFDVWGYQEECVTHKDVLRSYVKHRRDIISWLNEYAGSPRDLVIEHTLLRAQRRAYYINRIKKHASTAKIWCWYTTNPGACGSGVMEMYEYPDGSEGFDRACPIPMPGQFSMQCTHCGKENVAWVGAYHPYSTEHWQCPLCDSTYITEDYPR